MTRTCPACGRTWDGRATWCGACGAGLADAPTAEQDQRRGPPRPSRTAVATTVLGVVGALTAAWLVGAPSDRADGDGAQGPVVGGIEVPSRPATDAGAGNGGAVDGGVPVELLATCDGPGGPAGCVRWVQRAGQLPRPGAGALVTVVGDRLVGVDVATGGRRWTAAATPPVSAPLVVGDHTVLLEDGRGVRALDVVDGDQRWHLEAQHLPATSPAPLDVEVVVLDDLAGTLTGVDVRDGTVRWTGPTDPALGRPVATVALPAGRTLVATAGSTRVLDAATGALLWSDEASLLAVTDLHVVTLRAGTGGRVLTARRPDGALVARAPLPEDATLRGVAITGTRLVLRTSDAIVTLYLSDLQERWRRDDLPVQLVTSRPLVVAGNGRVDGVTGLATVALRSTALVAWRNDGTAVVLDERTGREVRTIGEPADGLRISDGFLARRRLWRVDSQSLEVHDFATGDLELRIEVRAPPSVVLTRPVVVATSGRFVRLDTAATVPGGIEAPR